MMGKLIVDMPDEPLKYLDSIIQKKLAGSLGNSMYPQTNT